MRTEPRGAVLSCALLAFVLTCALGGAGAAWLLSAEQERAEAAVRRDAAELAGAVARTLARQFEKAVRNGIPLERLPGVEPYLKRTVASVPGLASIAVRDASGRVLHEVQREGATAGEIVRVPVVGSRAPRPFQPHAEADPDTTVMGAGPEAVAAAGRIEVATAASGALTDAWLASAIAVAGAALCAALAAAVFVGGALQRRSERLAGWLEAAARGETVEAPVRPAGGDALARAERAFADAQAQHQEHLHAFDDYAQELLAVDFDGALLPQVAAIARDTIGVEHAPSIAAGAERA